MGYTLEDAEIGIIIKPCLDEDGSWDGTISTDLALNRDAWKDDVELANLIHITTMMACLPSFLDEYPEMYEAIEEIRNRIMGLSFDEEEENKTVESNVISFNRGTKTHGRA
jgi:hypothetical protein